MLRVAVVCAFVVSCTRVVVTDDASVEALIQVKVKEQLNIVSLAEDALQSQDEVLSSSSTSAIQEYKNIVTGKVSLMQAGARDVEESNYLTDRLSEIQYKMFVKHVKQVEKDMLAAAARLSAILTQEGISTGNEEAGLFYRILRDQAKSVISRDRASVGEIEVDFKEAQEVFKTGYSKLFFQMFDNRQSVAMLSKLFIESKCAVPFVDSNDTFWLRVKKPQGPTLNFEVEEAPAEAPQMFMQFAEAHRSNEEVQKLVKCVLQMQDQEWPQGATPYALEFNCPAGFKQPCEDEGTITGFVNTIKPWYDRAKQQVQLYTALMNSAMKSWLNRKERMLDQTKVLNDKISDYQAAVKSYESKAQGHVSVAAKYAKKAQRSRKSHNAATATSQANSRTREDRITALACLKLNIAKVAKEKGEAVTPPVDCVFAPEPKILAECSVSCGSGNETVQTQVIQNHSHFGMRCPDGNVTYRFCTLNPCPTDCQMGAWAKAWSRCSKACGGGEQYKRRGIRQAPMNKGNRCGSTTTTQPCNQQACARFEWDFKLPVNCEAQATVEGGECDIGTGKKARVNSILTGFEIGKSVIQLNAVAKPGSCPDGWNQVTSIITANPISQAAAFAFKQVSVRDILQPLSEKLYLDLVKEYKEFYTTQNVTAFGTKFAVRTGRKEVSGEFVEKLKDVKYMQVECPKGWFINNIRVKNDGSSQPYGFSRMDDFMCIKRRGGANDYDGKCVDHEINWFDMGVLKKQTEFKCTGKNMLAGFRSDWRCQKKGGLSCIRSMKCCKMSFKPPKKAQRKL